MSSPRRLTGAGRIAILAALLSVLALLTGKAAEAHDAQNLPVLRIVFFANGYGEMFPCPT
ncbi:hypothetical protein N1030_04240 [Desulfovibrio mangrovi]|uniref:hypothetical protein n=1 Tax=Desulfovibrio mangrovi TaxID=2976983 RepID=UPI00224693F1|nr:hypothetical protein [Desulfovibrio mangrovi]UZP68195.1 hypothetical protein N1030_04240 [Desulfovibrio mangrovi]